jgi:GNAT superfamily N-acetyltransferase
MLLALLLLAFSRTCIRGQHVERERQLLRIETAHKSNIKDIPNPCKYCLYWQTTGDFGEKMLNPQKEQKKRDWFNMVAEKFGSSFKLGYLNETPVGFIQYSLPRFFPRVKEYASGPPSDDAAFITCLYIVDKKARGKGFGTDMLNDLIADLKRRGFRAVETFARKDSQDNPSGPLEFYLKNGFKIKNDKSDFPLVRLAW